MKQPQYNFKIPTYIVLSVPTPVADKIREIRRHFDAGRVKMAVEICLAGSNGLGTVAANQPDGLVFAEFDRIAARCEPFTARFGSAQRFTDTGIYYYTLNDPEPFTKINQLLAKSRIKFNPVAFPYEPHCTLKLSVKPEKDDNQIITRIQPPTDEFTINTMSIYQLPSADSEPRLLRRANFGQTQPTTKD